MNFSEELFAFRVKHGLTQKATAEILGAERSSVVNYEKEKTIPTRLHRATMERKMEEYERSLKKC